MQKMGKVFFGTLESPCTGVSGWSSSSNRLENKKGFSTFFLAKNFITKTA